MPTGHSRSRWAPTRATTPATLSRSCARRRSPRMSLKIPTAAVRRSTAAPPATPAMRSPSAFANASTKLSAGLRRWPGCARCVIADCPRSVGNSPSPWRPITSSACPSCSSSLLHDLPYLLPIVRCCPRPLTTRHCGGSPPFTRPNDPPWKPTSRLISRFSAACSHVRFQGFGRNYLFRCSGRGRLIGAHSRRQDPKTPVEQALMRGLVTA
jgi:hypothetical protein